MFRVARSGDADQLVVGLCGSHKPSLPSCRKIGTVKATGLSSALIKSREPSTALDSRISRGAAWSLNKPGNQSNAPACDGTYRQSTYNRDYQQKRKRDLHLRPASFVLRQWIESAYRDRTQSIFELPPSGLSVASEMACLSVNQNPLIERVQTRWKETVREVELGSSASFDTYLVDILIGLVTDHFTTSK